MFTKPGYKNTAQALEIMLQGVEEYGVKEVVVASTYGDTALEAAKMLQNKDVKLVVVTHNYGFKKPGSHEMTLETRKQLEQGGAVVYTGTMPFRNIGTSIREKQSYSQQDLVANTLRMLGQGIKVCVEIVLMAADSGNIGNDDVLAVAGTGRGADTVALIEPQSSNRLFQIKIKNILAKPLDW